MGSPGGAAVLPGQRIRPTPGVDRRRERPGESLWKAGQMPRQRIQHSRKTDDFPERLVRFRVVSRMRWAEIARRLGAGPKTVRRWHKHGVQPNAHYLLAPRDLAKGRGLGYLFTVRATPHQTAESEGREDSGQGPADRTTGGEQNAGRPGHSQEGLPLSPRKDQRCYAQRARTPQHR